ncbi:hypothetical protein EV363DRAFT_1419176 [Boletus edulis]|nr:hypothetical protein EV363DRAFT_1419176 [Boletus edulis]
MAAPDIEVVDSRSSTWRALSMGGRCSPEGRYWIRRRSVWAELEGHWKKPNLIDITQPLGRMPPPPSSHARHAEQPRKLLHRSLRAPREFSDLEDAISTHRDAVHLSDGHPDKPSRLNNLGLSFRARFECLGEPSDLEDAISLYSHPASVSIGPISRASQNRILCARPDGRRSKTAMGGEGLTDEAIHIAAGMLFAGGVIGMMWLIYRSATGLRLAPDASCGIVRRDVYGICHSSWPRRMKTRRESERTQAPSTSKQGQRSLHGIGPGAQEDEEEIRTDEPANERSRNAAAAREVSREMDVLMFSAINCTAIAEVLSPSPILPPNPPDIFSVKYKVI